MDLDIFYFIKTGDILQCFVMLENRNTLNLEDWSYGDRRNVLMSLCAEGMVEVVERAIDVGADPNSKDRDSWTALHYAAYFNHSNCIGLLLDRGANPEAINNKRLKPLNLAEQEGHAECMKLLLAVTSGF